MADFSEHFSVDSALLEELGERLVTTPHVALAELVKNSYDADATEVKVIVRESANGGPEIEIKDNGNGMTLRQIKNFWMRIGNTHKSTELHSPVFGRLLSGSKGIGRFCVRRLGTRVKVESMAKGSGQFEENVLEIDWKRFIAGEDVSEVPVQGKSLSKARGKTGLTLTMSGHRRIEWQSLTDQRSYGYLLRQLATLTANRGTKRPGYDPDPGFSVTLNAPILQLGYLTGSLMDEDDDLAIDIRKNLMNAGWALLEAHVGSDGYIHCDLNAAPPLGVKTFIGKDKFSSLTDVSLTLAIFVEENGWNRDEKLVPLGKLNAILNDWGGVQLRYKGMRVFPYGEPEDDWLNIEKDRARRLGKPPQSDLIDFVGTLKARTPLEPGRVLLNMLSHKAYLGAVEIGEEQLGLEAKADREGFVENLTMREIKQFARFAIDWAMIWRDFTIKERERQHAERLRKQLERGTGGKTIVPAEQSKAALSVLRNGVAQLRDAKSRNEPALITEQEITNLATAASLLESEIKTSRADLLRFQLVASAATLSLLYHHEVRFLAQTLATFTADLNEAIGVLSGVAKKRCQEVLESVGAAKDSLDTLGDLTQDMGVLDRKAEAKKLDLAKQVERAVARFKRVADVYHVKFMENIEGGYLVGPMLRGELAAILLNVISNALKAVIAGGATKGMIEFRAYRSRNKVCLDIMDNGIGMTKEESEAVFTPLVSDPSSKLYDALEERLAAEDRQLLGQGSGLGLSIVHGILENRKGSVQFIQPTKGWSTCLHLVLPTPA